MAVRIEHKKLLDELPEIQKEIAKANGTGIEVGVLTGEHVWLASIHEYGLTMKVTNKQRRFMAKQGLLLGKELKIPERSFLRAGYDFYRDETIKKTAMLMADATRGKRTSRGLHQAVGQHLASRIKEYATDILKSPPNHPFTIEQKGSSNPLVDGGGMIGGITWRKAK